MTALPRHDDATGWYLAVDGGGSKTLALIVDSNGTERGRGIAGSANYHAVGVAHAVAHIQRASASAAEQAGCSLPVAAAWVGLASIDHPADEAMIAPHLHTLAEYIHLTNDADLVLGALAEAVGVALIAGTGAIALGRDAHGATARASGWGHLLGDEGSGYDMGVQALRAAVRAADGRAQPTQLLAAIMSAWELRLPTDLIDQVYGATDKARIARLSTIVLATARDGDGVALRIMRRSAAELARAVTTVSAALDFGDAATPLALGGGLLIHEADFRAEIVRRVQRSQPVDTVAIVAEPALSAARAIVHLAASA